MTIKDTLICTGFVTGLIIIGVIFGLFVCIWERNHRLEDMKSYDYIIIESVAYKTEDIETIKLIEWDKGTTFYLKDGTKIHCTNYTYTNNIAPRDQTERIE